MKNVISKSFEIQDYMLEGTHINGFWMNLIDKEKLTTEIVYAAVNGKTFEMSETERIIGNIITKCDRFKSLLPDNINCEVTFKDFNGLMYTASGNKPDIEPKELDEIRVVYRFYVEYYV